MALQKSYTLKGFNFPESYNVISDVRYTKFGQRVRFMVNSYPNSSSREDNFFDNPVLQKDYVFTAEGDYTVDENTNIFNICYSYLKSLPEWSGSIDV